MVLNQSEIFKQLVARIKLNSVSFYVENQCNSGFNDNILLFL